MNEPETCVILHAKKAFKFQLIFGVCSNLNPVDNCSFENADNSDFFPDFDWFKNFYNSLASLPGAFAESHLPAVISGTSTRLLDMAPNTKDE
jgi:hypothetical protein